MAHEKSVEDSGAAYPMMAGRRDAAGARHADWRDVGSMHDIPQRGARVVTTARGDIAVFRTGDDHVFALLDACPHKAGRLSQGIVHGHSVTCPLHNWVIALTDGKAREPDEGCAHTVPARLDGDRILLAVDA